MKKLILLFFCIFFNASFSQVKYGSIVYSLTPIENGSNLDKMYLQMSIGFIERARQFDFNLIFDSKHAFFDINKIYKYDTSKETTFAKLKIEFGGEIWQTKDSVYSDVNLGYLGNNLIVKKEAEKNWVLYNETKKIDRFVCYKATTEIVRVTPQKTFRFPVTAWYCPEINVPFGPLEFGNLPGLILELQTKDAVFEVKTISINPEEKIEVPKLKKGKILSEKELDGIITRYNDEKNSNNSKR
ncbi:GLPGLI family protein [Flavobacterium notoginsengisoli]|uniref:GLPGLI family protein n=1 Tax=Flavobacterium notoginsengisoli TaxID=1478199 RepID=UPI003634F6F5